MDKVETVETNKEVNCPHYEGDGYTYEFDGIEFNFCEKCNDKLLIRMLDQKRLEIEAEVLWKSQNKEEKDNDK